MKHGVGERFSQTWFEAAPLILLAVSCAWLCCRIRPFRKIVVERKLCVRLGQCVCTDEQSIEMDFCVRDVSLMWCSYCTLQWFCVTFCHTLYAKARTAVCVSVFPHPANCGRSTFIVSINTNTHKIPLMLTQSACLFLSDKQRKTVLTGRGQRL